MKNSVELNMTINLNTHQGNPFYLLGVARILAKDLGFDFNIINYKMTRGNNENRLSVFREYFGDHVTLIN